MILEKIMDIFKGGGGAFDVITLPLTFLAYRMTRAVDSDEVVFWTTEGQRQYLPSDVKAINLVSIQELVERSAYWENRCKQSEKKQFFPLPIKEGKTSEAIVGEKLALEESSLILEGNSLTIENIARECQKNRRYAIVRILAAGMNLCLLAYFFMAKDSLSCEIATMTLPVTNEWLKRVKEIEFRPLQVC